MVTVTCGFCHTSGQSIEHVRECATSRYTTVKEAPVSTHVEAYAASDYKPMAFAAQTPPDARYALQDVDAVRFYQVKSGKGRWDGYTFLDLLVGAPGDFRSFPVKGAARKAVMDRLAADPKAAAKRFADEFSCCAACMSPLTDSESRARGLGPVCAEKF